MEIVLWNLCILIKYIYDFSVNSKENINIQICQCKHKYRVNRAAAVTKNNFFVLIIPEKAWKLD